MGAAEEIPKLPGLQELAGSRASAVSNPISITVVTAGV
jgi:hypothetical protein